jgi:antitoxin VapB
MYVDPVLLPTFSKPSRLGWGAGASFFVCPHVISTCGNVGQCLHLLHSTPFGYMLFVYLKDATMQTAKLSQNGQSQAVRLPKEFRFQGDKVFIKPMGNAVVLLPYHDSWQSLFDSLNQFLDDCMAERQQPSQ